MRMLLLVAWHEIVTLLRRPTFYVATFVVPLFVGAIVVGSGYLAQRTVASIENEPLPATRNLIGLVDRAGIVAAIPEALHRNVVPFANEPSALQAFEEKRVRSYFVIAEDYLQSGRIVRVSDQNALGSASAADTRLIETLIRANLLADVQLAQRLDQPLNLAEEVTEAVAPRSDNQRVVGIGLAMLLAFAILNGGGWLIQAISEEKESRTIEVLLTSIRPLHLMGGKLLGLSVLSLLQLTIWTLLSRGGLRQASALGVGSLEVAPALWGWIAVLFVLGYLFYGAIMLALGAVGASARESGQLSAFLTIPMIAPLWFTEAIIERPNSWFVIVLSLFPVSAPVTIVLRLAQGAIPAWQLLASVGVLALSVVGALWLAARMFRSATLLTGVRPTPRVLWRALRAG